MSLKSEAKAIAQLDAICDEFEHAIRTGAATSAASSDDGLGPWMQRVAPELQPWLREELIALREELQSSAEEIPEDICAESWNIVSHCPTFNQLHRDIKLSVARDVEPRRFETGGVLLRSGERASGLYLITAGRVQVTHSDEAGRREIDTDEPGSVLGEMSMLTGYPCTADVVATTPVEALVLPLAAFDALRRTSPEIEIAISRLVSNRLGHHRYDALCGKSLEGYQLQRCIGRGAMGVVYQAVRESDGAPCALKMLPHRFLYSPDVVSRFDQETELLRRLEHPNIVAFRGHFVAFSTRFIILDLYDGADLQTVIRHHGGISETTARSVLGQIAAGLLHAHQSGVLHLDLKPANILVRGDGQIAITDFGLSRLIETGGSDQTLVGTPLYMPPEQFLMEAIGPHCDWYSLGCIMYELMSGQRLFQDDRSSSLLDAKFCHPTSQWPRLDQASDEFLQHLRGALEPMAEERRLDLETIANWARPVPELAVALDNQPSTISG